MRVASDAVGAQQRDGHFALHRFRLGRRLQRAAGEEVGQGRPVMRRRHGLDLRHAIRRDEEF